jgi:hypothetical protein
MRRITEALDAWRAAIREMESAAPFTPSWFRARLLEDERRREYQARAVDAAKADSATLSPPSPK